MITGIDVRLSQKYISKYDTSEPKTTWHLGVLSVHIFAYLGEKMLDSAKSMESMIDIVSFGLKGFENFKDKDGKDVEFTTKNTNICGKAYQVVSDNIISIIPVDIIVELGSKILEITKLSESQIKN